MLPMFDEGEPPVRVRGWWILGVDAAPEQPPVLMVAPVGSYARARPQVLRPESLLSALLGIEPDELATPGAAEAITGVAWAETGAGMCWELPRPTSSPRPLLITDQGRRVESLAAACGVEVDALVGSVELVEPRRAQLRGRHVVALCAADQLPATTGAGSIHVAGPRWQDATAETAAAVLRAAVAARRCSEDPEVGALELMLAGAASLGAAGLARVQAAWGHAARVGVTWPGSSPSAGWSFGQQGPLFRSYATAHGGPVRAEVNGPPWQAAVTAPGRAPAWRSCADLESALLVADLLARARDGLTPWERRDARYDAEGSSRV